MASLAASPPASTDVRDALRENDAQVRDFRDPFCPHAAPDAVGRVSRRDSRDMAAVLEPGVALTSELGPGPRARATTRLALELAPASLVSATKVVTLKDTEKEKEQATDGDEAMQVDGEPPKSEPEVEEKKMFRSSYSRVVGYTPELSSLQERAYFSEKIQVYHGPKKTIYWFDEVRNDGKNSQYHPVQSC